MKSLGLKKEILPDFVFRAWNEVIATHWNGNSSSFIANEVSELMRIYGNLDEKSRPKANWYNVLSIYRAEGWDITNDIPGYNESYYTTYIFTKKKWS